MLMLPVYLMTEMTFIVFIYTFIPTAILTGHQTKHHSNSSTGQLSEELKKEQKVFIWMTLLHILA